ncbi:MAG TPA: exopolysaccharide biosynthesis polyprenyl glycosylphosphotransferase [Clostridia bacterium]|nr:exopolysaccharide biosynthesis polyprenyl glycosylphosphotransferase [Clostridia bacterium]
MKKASPREFKKTAVFTAKALIVLATVTAFGYVIFDFYSVSLFYFRGNVLLLLFYAFLFLVFASVYNCFKVGAFPLKELIFSYALAVFVTNFAAYCVLSLLARKMLDFWPLVFLSVAQVFLCSALFWMADDIYFRLYPARNAVLICGKNKSDADIIKKFNRPKKHRFVSLVCSESEGYEALTEKIDAYPCVVLGEIDFPLRLRLLDYCFEHDKRLYLMPAMQDIMVHLAYDIFIGDSATLLLKNRGLTIEQRFMKRAVDLLIAGAGLIVLSPLLLIVAAAVKMEDGGKILYKQKRLTKDGEVFTMVKFRSMREDAERMGGPRLAKKNDERVTHVGKIIRMLRIDELPQLWNVLKGEMSVVGPRPERPEIFEKAAKELPQFRYRLKVKAGLTGYAQIYGKYNTTFEDKVKMDLIYIEHCSLILDVKLMLSTLKVLFVRESTEGVNENR